MRFSLFSEWFNKQHGAAEGFVFHGQTFKPRTHSQQLELRLRNKFKANY